MRRIVRDARPLSGAGWDEVLCDAADRLGLADVPRLVASEGTDVPFASGLWRGMIVLPGDADEWSDERRRLVLFHELAHLKRRDLASHLLGRVACAAYWFHPLAWVAARRLRAESERACDDLVLASGARPSYYASHLLEILTSARATGAPQAVVAMARRAEFEGRMLAILDPAARRGVLGRAPSAVLATGLGALFLCVAALAPSSPAAPAAAAASPEPAARPAEAAAADERPVISPREVRARSRSRRARRWPRLGHEHARERERDRDHEGENENEESKDAQPSGDELGAAREGPADGRRRIRAPLGRLGALGRRRRRGCHALAAALKSDADAGVREMAAWALADASGDARHAGAREGAPGRRERATSARSRPGRWDSGRTRTRRSLPAAADRSASTSARTRSGASDSRTWRRRPRRSWRRCGTSRRPVRLVAAWTLAQIGDPATAPALRAAFKDEKDDEVRQGLFHALTLVGDRSPEVIAQMLEEKDPELRAQAVQTLSRREGLGPWPWPRPTRVRSPDAP